MSRDELTKLSPTRPTAFTAQSEAEGSRLPGDVEIPDDERTGADGADLVAGYQIGLGGVGEVHVYDEPALMRKIAIKRPVDRECDIRKASVVREAQIMAQLSHPYIVPVHRLVSGDGELYFGMQLVEGDTLSEMISESHRRGEQHSFEYLHQIVEILIKVCDALAQAHERGVVHCDVKPDNIMIGDHGRVYVMDWGIARLRREWGGTTTPTGTPAFCAPEQLLGEQLGPHTDVYSLGATMCYALTGKPLRRDILGFDATGHARSVSDLGVTVEDLHTPVSQVFIDLGDDVPRQLAQIIARALEPRAKDRFPSVIEFRSELLAFARGEYELPVQRFQPGQAIIREGAVCNPHKASTAGAYLIESGTCKVYQGEGEQRRYLRTLQPGDAFGEGAVLYALYLESKPGRHAQPVTRTATVEAETEVRVRRVDARLFSEQMQGMRRGLDKFVFALARWFVESQGDERE